MAKAQKWQEKILSYAINGLWRWKKNTQHLSALHSVIISIPHFRILKCCRFQHNKKVIYEKNHLWFCYQDLLLYLCQKNVRFWFLMPLFGFLFYLLEPKWEAWIIALIKINMLKESTMKKASCLSYTWNKIQMWPYQFITFLDQYGFIFNEGLANIWLLKLIITDC